MTNVVGDKVKPKIRNEIEEAILNLEVMPSMRSLMTAGQALDRDNTAGYNCSYTPIDHPRCFDEVLYILLCGTGVWLQRRRTVRQQTTRRTTYTLRVR